MNGCDTYMILPWRVLHILYHHISRTLEALYKRLWFLSSKSTSFCNGALVNVLSLWKKAEEKKWKQRNWVLAVFECNARGLYFQEKLMTLYNGQWYWNYFYWFNCCPHFFLYCYHTPPHSTYLLTMIHLCTCTQALYSMIFICMLLIWVLEKYEIGFTALQNYSNVEKRIPYQ